MVHFQRRCKPFRPVQAAFGHIRSGTTRPALAGRSAMKSGHGELANRLGDVVPSFAERAPVQVRGRQRAKVETHRRGRPGRRPLLTENRRNQSRPPRAWHGRRCQLPVTTVRTPHATGPTFPRSCPPCASVRFSADISPAKGGPIVQPTLQNDKTRGGQRSRERG